MEALLALLVVVAVFGWTVHQGVRTRSTPLSAWVAAVALAIPGLCVFTPQTLLAALTLVLVSVTLAGLVASLAVGPALVPGRPQGGNPRPAFGRFLPQGEDTGRGASETGQPPPPSAGGDRTRPAGVKLVLLASWIPVGIGLAVWLPWSAERWRTMQRLAQRYPVAVHPKPKSYPSTAASAETETMDNLLGSELGVRGTFRGRDRILTAVHRSAVDRFATAAGFGAGRMGPVGLRPDWVEVEPLPRLPVDTPAKDPATPPPGLLPDEPDWVRQAVEGLSGRPLTATLLTLDAVEFANGEGFGPVLSETSDTLTIAGFQPHGFRRGSRVAADRPDLRLVRLQLVGLLMHDEPVVYDSDNLPNMERVAEYPTRPPDAFERSALAKLRNGETLVTGETGDSLRLLGAIRNIDACADCHDGGAGSLLGAFSYEFAARR